MKRPYVIKAAYPSKEPFLFGTIHTESPDSLLRLYEELWATISPHPAPPLVEAMPGMIFFHGTED